MGFVLTRDAALASAYYVDLLELTLISEDSFATEVSAHGTHIRIVNAPPSTPFPFTLLGWRVPDIVVAARTLAAKGVVFECYDWCEQDADAIWTAPGGAKVVWFRARTGTRFPFRSIRRRVPCPALQAESALIQGHLIRLSAAILRA